MAERSGREKKGEDGVRGYASAGTFQFHFALGREERDGPKEAPTFCAIAHSPFFAIAPFPLDPLNVFYRHESRSGNMESP